MRWWHRGDNPVGRDTESELESELPGKERREIETQGWEDAWTPSLSGADADADEDWTDYDDDDDDEIGV